MAAAAALGVFVDKEAHKTLLHIADNHKQVGYIQELRQGVNHLTRYADQAQQQIVRYSEAVLEYDEKLQECDNERLALLRHCTKLEESIRSLESELQRAKHNNLFLSQESTALVNVRAGADLLHFDSEDSE